MGPGPSKVAVLFADKDNSTHRERTLCDDLAYLGEDGAKCGFEVGS